MEIIFFNWLTIIHKRYYVANMGFSEVPVDSRGRDINGKRIV